MSNTAQEMYEGLPVIEAVDREELNKVLDDIEKATGERPERVAVKIPYGTTEIANYAFLPIDDDVCPEDRAEDYVVSDWTIGYVIIPNTVVKIGNHAFQDCKALKSVLIPDSVTEIGEDAFAGCYGLANIVIPDSVTVIGSAAFRGCSGLTNIIIPDSVMRIGHRAFWGCVALTSIVVSKGNKKYDSRNNCNAIIETSTNRLLFGCQNTIIPDSVMAIGPGAFFCCAALTSVIIPDFVTEIGIEAFCGCSGLTNIIIPNLVTKIGYRAFADCVSLKSIVIPGSVTEIGDRAFFGCDALTSIVIPASVTEIGEKVFCCCFGLTSIVIPNSVTKIGEGALCSTALTSIVIPDSVTVIGNDAFEGCNSLTSIVIPDSVTVIGNHAFEGCKSLTSIVIPDSVTEIGEYAFRYCSGLTNIIIPNSVKEIGYRAFAGCDSLTNIVIGKDAGTRGLEHPDGFHLAQIALGIPVPQKVSDTYDGCEAIKNVIVQGNEWGQTVDSKWLIENIRNLGDIYATKEMKHNERYGNYLVIHDDGSNRVWLNENGDVFMLGIKEQGLLIISDYVDKTSLRMINFVLQAAKVQFGYTLIITTASRLGLDDPQVRKEYEEVCNEQIHKKYQRYVERDQAEKNTFPGSF